MARTKGALSKKTLAKQLGISLEEYLELEKNGKLEEYRTEHGIVDQDLPRAWHDTISSSISNEAEKERKEEIRTELQAKKIAKTGKTPEPSPDYKPNQKLTTSTKPNITASTKILLPSNSSKSEDERNDKAESVKVVESVKSAFKSEVKVKPNECFCTRCHKLILKDSSFRLILSNMIPGIASYHYSVADKQVLCYDCAHGLARVIEGYFEDEIGNEELNTPISDEPDDTNIKEMVKPVEDIKPSEDEDLVF